MISFHCCSSIESLCHFPGFQSFKLQFRIAALVCFAQWGKLPCIHPMHDFFHHVRLIFSGSKCGLNHISFFVLMFQPALSSAARNKGEDHAAVEVPRRVIVHCPYSFDGPCELPHKDRRKEGHAASQCATVAFILRDEFY